jgi:hypothetical protein
MTGIMAQFVVNPRRTPRAPARCRAEVVFPQGRFEVETEDIGSMGCQVVSPKLVRKGDAVRLAVSNDAVGEPLHVTGRVAWVSGQPPWRVGIAFDEGSLAESARWFERLISAYPGLAGYRKVPERIPTDATVYLGPPPRFLLDFTSDEAALLRAIASGARLDELMARMRDRWPAAQRALFSLIARQAVTLHRGNAVHPAAWKQILTDIEASLAVESLGKDGPVAAPLEPPSPPPRPAATPPPVAASRTPAAGTPVPARTPPRAGTPLAGTFTPVPSPAHTGPYGLPARTPAPGWSERTPYDGTRMVDLPPEEGPPLEIAPEAPAAREVRPPAADHAGAGGGWRRSARRSPQAQAVFERALAEMRASNVNRAIGLLREALSLAPGDPEIAQELGQLAFKDRLR